MTSELEELKSVVAQLQKQVGRLSGTSLFRHHGPNTADNIKDQEDVRKLQYTYGYYLDKCLYKEVNMSAPAIRILADCAGRGPLLEPS
jgi:hypothetical protein